MNHFLDPEGNIAKEMHKHGREHASFLALLIDAATKVYPPSFESTEIKCIKKRCNGTIEIGFDTKDENIEWWCTKCSEDGLLSGWQGSRWDNRK